MDQQSKGHPTETPATSSIQAEITLSEWSRSAPLDLSERDIEMIDNEVNADRTQLDYDHNQEGQTELRTTHYVGIVSLPDGPVVEIAPKAAGSNLLSLLRYARAIDQSILDTETTVSKGREFLDAIAALYLDELDTLMRHGLHTDYQRVTDTEKYLRGQVDTQRQLQRQGVAGTQFECRYDTLTANTVANQAILYATSILTRLVSSLDLRQQLKRHSIRFRRQVDLRAVQHHELQQIEVTRLNEHYADILRLTELIIQNIHMDNFTHGEHPSFSILVNMNRVFESVVERAVREAVADITQWSVEGQAQINGLVTGGKYPVNMKPDFVIRNADDEVILVGDAKWKVGKPKQSDIYQMSAYQLADDVPGLLVYPAQGQQNVTEYVVRDEHKLRLIELPTDKERMDFEQLATLLRDTVSDEIAAFGLGSL